MGAVICAPSGVVLGVHMNSGFWGDPSKCKRENSDVHAEVNTLGICARRGVSTEGATAYITMPPCKRCFLVLASAGVRRMVFRKDFHPQEGKDIVPVAKRLDIDTVVIGDTDERRARIERLITGKRAEPTEPRSTPSEQD